MRLKSAVILTCFLFLSGCLGWSECSIVNQTVNVTEVYYESIPRNITERYEGPEPYIIRQYKDVPLSYQVVRGARISKTPTSDESDTWIEYGRLDQKLNGTVYITLMNNDSLGGFFEIELTLFRGDKNFSSSRRDYLNPFESKDFEFNFDLVRGGNWSYRFRVIPPTRKVEVKSLDHKMVNKTRVVTVFDTVRREVVRPVVREVKVC